MTDLQSIDRRTALKTAGGLLAGTTILSRSGVAQGEGLTLDVRQEAIDPEEHGVVPTSVQIPEPQFDPGEVPEAYHFGHAEQAIYEEAGKVHSLQGEFARPVHVREIPGTGWVMHFETQDIDFSAVDDDAESIEMLLAVPGDSWFPGSSWVPGDSWDTDEVRFPGSSWNSGTE